jgi:hypothetical protein
MEINEDAAHKLFVGCTITGVVVGSIVGALKPKWEKIHLKTNISSNKMKGGESKFIFNFYEIFYLNLTQLEVIMKSYKIYLTLLVVILVAGCTSTFQMTPKSPLNAKLNNYNKVYLSVESNVTDDVEKELSDLRGLTLSKILSLNAFNKVQLASATDVYNKGSLLLKVTISDVRKVSGANRFMLGAFAGKASMNVYIEFIDALKNKSIGSYTATGSSGGTGYSGGTSDAVKKTVEAIMDVIKNNL